MKNFVFELWYWLTVFFAVTFTYAFGVRWIQTMSYSAGHRIIGLLGVSSVAVCVLILGLAREFAYIFLPLGCLGLTAWLLYNNWFNRHYPVPMGGMRSVAKPGEPDYVAQSRLLRYLANPEKHEKQKPLYIRTIQVVGLALGLVFAFGFGFSRVVYYIHDGDRRVAETIKATSQKSDQTLKIAVSEVTKQTQAVVDSTKVSFYKAVDTLTKGQKHLDQKLDKNNAASLLRAAEVKRDLKKANAQLSRPAPILINPPTARQLPQSNFKLPTPANQIPVERSLKRGKSFGLYLESEPEADSSLYAKFQY